MTGEGKLLEGKRILVTGGSRGLGRALCLTFAQEGARVAFTFSQHEKEAQAVCESCQAMGRESRRFQASVLDLPATQQVVAELEKDWDGIDILVNNAGITQIYPFALLEEEDWDRVMDINAKGIYFTCRAVLPGMIRRKAGVILNLGSLAGTRMLEAPVHYCASKAAVKGMTQSLAKELARYRIRVLCLAPGLLDDGMGRNVPETSLAEYLKHCALGRLGTLDEAAQFAAFLVSDLNTYMNGETIVMDGGVA